jgi:predicted XRE-type DNA-binding protein
MHDSKLGTQINQYCIKNKISQKTFGEKFGVSQPTVHEWVKGKMPSKEHYEQIKAVLSQDTSGPSMQDLSISKRLFEHFSLEEIPILGKIIEKLRG